MSFTHPTRAHCLPGSTCTILPRRHSNTRCFYSCVFYFFLRSVHIVIFEPRAPCGSLWSKKKRKEKKVLVASVCVTEAGCVSALSTSPHCLYTSGRRRRSTRCFHGYGMNVQVITPRITAAIVNFFFLGCQRRCEGAGVERVLKQPWNKNK